MNIIGPSFAKRARRMVAGLVAACLLAGCGTLMMPKHKVTVDAICLQGVEKPAGKSFRIVARTSMGAGQVNVAVVSACVAAALAHAGMYEAPSNAPPDILIEVNCGQESAPRADPSTRETFLELSARTNTKRAMESSRDPEIWNVRVSIQGGTSRIEQAMPLLSAVASSYTAMDTRFQTLIEVPQANASVAVVRQAALKTLEERGLLAPAPAPGAAATPIVK